MDSIEYEKKVPEWASHANMYEVNVRQYTPEGTFKAFQQHLPRLKKMGVEILWLMPINPIGEHNRKGTLGSYYSVKNYTAVNPEFFVRCKMRIQRKFSSKKRFSSRIWELNLFCID